MLPFGLLIIAICLPPAAPDSAFLLAYSTCTDTRNIKVSSFNLLQLHSHMLVQVIICIELNFLVSAGLQHSDFPVFIDGLRDFIADIS
ncbi:hypothetical protein ACNKHN_10735 [Shigella flexneri]